MTQKRLKSSTSPLQRLNIRRTLLVKAFAGAMMAMSLVWVIDPEPSHRPLDARINRVKFQPKPASHKSHPQQEALITLEAERKKLRFSKDGQKQSKMSQIDLEIGLRKEMEDIGLRLELHESDPEFDPIPFEVRLEHLEKEINQAASISHQ